MKLLRATTIACLVMTGAELVAFVLTRDPAVMLPVLLPMYLMWSLVWTVPADHR